MFQIAVCDDDKIFCEQFRNNLETVIKKLNIECDISIWYTGEELQEYLKRRNKVDLLFLDIELMELDGVSLGHFIRDRLLDYQMQLVYISHEKGYAMKLFETEPMDFLVKPIVAEHIEKVMRRFLKQRSNSGKLFTFKEVHGIAQIPYDSIWFFQSMNHKVLIHTSDGQREFYGKLTDVEDIAPDFFIRIHKSFLVNEYYISRFHYDKVILRNEQKLTIIKSCRTAVQERIRKAMKDFSEE